MNLKKEISVRKNILAIAPVENLHENINETIKYLTKKNIPGIFISLNKPYNSVKQTLEKEGISCKNLYFIDCITKATTTTARILFVSSPSDLTGMGIAIGRFIEKIPKEKFLIIDSLRTLLIYNKPKAIINFVKSLTERLSKFKLEIIIFITKGKNKILVKKISPFFDKVIEIEE